MLISVRFDLLDRYRYIKNCLTLANTDVNTIILYNLNFKASLLEHIDCENQDEYLIRFLAHNNHFSFQRVPILNAFICIQLVGAVTERFRLLADLLCSLFNVFTGQGWTSLFLRPKLSTKVQIDPV